MLNAMTDEKRFAIPSAKHRTMQRTPALEDGSCQYVRFATGDVLPRLHDHIPSVCALIDIGRFPCQLISCF